MELSDSQSVQPPEGVTGGEGNSSALQLYSSGETRTILSPFFLPGWPVLMLHWKSVRSNTALQGLSMDVSNKKSIAFPRGQDLGLVSSLPTHPKER